MNRMIWAIAAALLVAVLPIPVFADGNPPDGRDPFGSAPQVNVKVTSTPSGVYIQISVKENVPGNPAPTPQPILTPVPRPTPAPNDPPKAASTPGTDGSKTWSDATGIYEQTADGHLYYLTIPNISSQVDWSSLFQSHPNQTPFALYVDNQFRQLVWIPNSPSSGNVNFGAPPASTTVPGNPPAGNGSSTDPYQVALSLLDHVPLPNIQLKENPALGLVNLPGWFWVDGYDGRPFGTSRTVTIPPAVGPDVPFTQVPANDPRRQPTSFTVSVQIWATGYQWAFGDGSTLSTQSLGQPYPAQSDIQHTYQYSSLKTQSGFPIQLSVVFAAQYQVNGGAPQALPSISHTYNATYPVQEAQALLTSH